MTTTRRPVARTWVVNPRVLIRSGCSYSTTSKQTTERKSMRKPKAKVAKATPIKTARKSIAKINNLKAPGGVHTLRDVTAAFQSILSFDTNRQHNKTLAYQVLEKFGVRAVRDLPVNQYDAVIEAANVQRFQMTLRAAVERGHIEIARRETEARVQQYRAA